MHQTAFLFVSALPLGAVGKYLVHVFLHQSLAVYVASLLVAAVLSYVFLLLSATIMFHGAMELDQSFNVPVIVASLNIPYSPYNWIHVSLNICQANVGVK